MSRFSPHDDLPGQMPARPETTEMEGKAVDVSPLEPNLQGLRGFLRGRLRQEPDVEDCLQKVVVKWLEHGQHLTGGALRAWLFAVAGNEAAMFWRSESRSDRALRTWDGNLAESTQEYHLDRQESQLIVRQAVARLPEELRIIVQLRTEHDLTFNEIAVRLQIPLGTALSRMHRALARLETELQALKK
jgi:RNA polymerase sigma-70 factor (ECF subfamily)